MKQFSQVLAANKVAQLPSPVNTPVVSAGAHLPAAPPLVVHPTEPAGVSNSHKLTPDSATALHFLRFLSRGPDDTLFCFQYYNDKNPNKKYAPSGEFHANANEDTIRNLAYYNNKGSAIALNLNQTDGKGREKINQVAVRCLVVDMDEDLNGNPIPLTALNKIPMTPHIVVESSPNKFHAYYKVKDFPLDDFVISQAKLAALVGSDPMVDLLTQILRIPGFWHQKYGKLFQSTMVMDDTLPPYTRKDFEFLDSLPVPERRAKKKAGVNSVLPDKIKHGEMHGHLVSIIGKFHSMGMTPAEVYKATAGIIETRFEPPVDLEKVQALVNDITSRYEQTKQLVSQNTEHWTPDGEGGFSDIQLQHMSDVEAKPYEWLWKDKIALGKLTMISGEPGVSKSLLTMDLAARVSTGANFPVDNTPCSKGRTLILAVDDDAADTMKPRLMAAGADCSKVTLIKTCLVKNFEGGIKTRLFSLQRDITALTRVIKSLGDVKLIIIDPITAYLGKKDANKMQDVYDLMTPLIDAAQDAHAAIITVSHLNKNTLLSAINRTNGSMGWNAVVRSAYIVSKDKENPKRRLMAMSKINIAKESQAMAYKVVEVQTSVGFHAKIEWETTYVDMTADEILNTDNSETDSNEIAEWLKDTLVVEPDLTVEKIFNKAKKPGYTHDQVNYAKRKLKIKSIKSTGSDGAWFWRLPTYQPSDSVPNGVPKSHNISTKLKTMIDTNQSQGLDEKLTAVKSEPNATENFVKRVKATQKKYVANPEKYEVIFHTEKEDIIKSIVEHKKAIASIEGDEK